MFSKIFSFTNENYTKILQKKSKISENSNHELFTSLTHGRLSKRLKINYLIN